MGMPWINRYFASKCQNNRTLKGNIYHLFFISFNCMRLSNIFFCSYFKLTAKLKWKSEKMYIFHKRRQINKKRYCYSIYNADNTIPFFHIVITGLRSCCIRFLGKRLLNARQISLYDCDKEKKIYFKNLSFCIYLFNRLAAPFPIKRLWQALEVVTRKEMGHCV